MPRPRPSPKVFTPLPLFPPMDWLPVRVQLLTVMVTPGPWLSMPPPLLVTPSPPVATLLVKVELLMTAVEDLALSTPASLSMAPPVAK